MSPRSNETALGTGSGVGFLASGSPRSHELYRADGSAATRIRRISSTGVLRRGFGPEEDSLRSSSRVQISWSHPLVTYVPRRMLRRGFEPRSLPREGNMIGRTTLSEPVFLGSPDSRLTIALRPRRGVNRHGTGDAVDSLDPPEPFSRRSARSGRRAVSGGACRRRRRRPTRRRATARDRRRRRRPGRHRRR